MFTTNLTRNQLYLLAILLLATVLRFAYLGSLSLFQDEAYYWVWAQHIEPGNLELSFYDHPPGIAYLIVISTSLFGDSEFGIRAIFAFIGVANVYLIYYLGRYLYDERTGLLGAFLLSINFFHILLSRTAMNDVAAIFIYTLLIYFFAKAMLEGSKKYLLLMGLFLGIGFLVKYTVPVIFLGFVVFVYFYPKYKKRFYNKYLIYSLFLAFICILPVLIWNIQNDWASVVYQGDHASPFKGLIEGPGGFWGRMVVSLAMYPFIWLMVISIPLTILLIWGVIDTFKWRLRKEPLLIAFLVLILRISAQEYLDIFTLIALDSIIIISLIYCVRGFKNERAALLVLTALAIWLFFAFSLGKMFHWTFPALAPMSILGSRVLIKLHKHFAANRTQYYAFAVSTAFLISWTSVYAVNSLYSIGAHENGPDPKSPFSPLWIYVVDSTGMFGDSLNQQIENYPNATILTANWVSYSPIAYYCPEKRDDIYTYQWDYQIGKVWKRDVNYMPDDVEEILVADYTSTFLGKADKERFISYLLYHQFGERNQYTVYNRTGFDYFVILESPPLVGNFTIYWQEYHQESYPFFIAYGKKVGTDEVTLKVDDLKFTAKKADLSFEAKYGLRWRKIFTIEQDG